jgi:hypothetical protein
VTEHLQASGGGRVHLGGYEVNDRAGWTPVCGDTTARRWFRTGFDADCPACLGFATPWTVAMVLDAVDDIADELEREQDTDEALFNTVQMAIIKLRALRGDSTGETDPVARMRASARLYGGKSS